MAWLTLRRLCEPNAGTSHSTFSKRKVLHRSKAASLSHLRCHTGTGQPSWAAFTVS